jgi:hypothetical protein
MRFSVAVRVSGPLALVALVACVSQTNNGPPTGIDAGVVLPDGGSSGTDASPGVDASTGTDASSGIDATTGDDGGACPAGWVTGAGGVCLVNLQGSWAPSTDANSNGPDTVATLGTVTATSVSVVQSHTGTPGGDCGCNAQHLNIALNKTFSCATSTLEFEYATTTTFTGTNRPGLDIRFCTGPCPAYDGGVSGPNFYGGPQYVGSPGAPGISSCAYEWENDAGTASTNYFPAEALIQTGQKTSIALGTYAAPSSQDNCTGSFDTIDIHMQVYNCYATETGTNTLSNVRIY